MNGSGGGQRCAQFGICKGAPMFDRRGNKRERARERESERERERERDRDHEISMALRV